MKKSGLSSHKIFALLIIVFLVHNCEEAIMMNGKAAESPVEYIKPLAYSQFLFAVLFLSIIVLAIYIYAIKTRNNKTYLFISTTIAAGLLINAFIPHIAVALYSMSYTPGLIAALFLIVPISILLLSKNKPLFESSRQLVYQIIIGLAIAYGLFALTILVAKLLI
jgi:cytochrome bd-type quinol oxidase subunit 1